MKERWNFLEQGQKVVKWRTRQKIRGKMIGSKPKREIREDVRNVRDHLTKSDQRIQQGQKKM